MTGTSSSIYGIKNTAVSDVASFTLDFDDPCIDENFVSITETSQTNPPADMYSGTDIIFTYDPFTIQAPSFCLSGIGAVSCNSVSPEN